MSRRNKIARIMLAVLPVFLILASVNVGLGWTPANLEDQEYFGELTGAYDKEILVGAYYYAGGWGADQQLYYNNSRMTGDAYNLKQMHWDYVKVRDQSDWDSQGFNITSGGYTHLFRNIDWEVKYLFDANQASMPTGQNYWTNVERGARFKQSQGHLFNWPDALTTHQPLSTTDGYLGQYDCDSSSVWQTQISNAAAYGVDFFAYEMHWNYDGGYEKKTPSKPIDSGFLAATNRNKMRFAFMWVNHDWDDGSGGAITGTQNYTTTALNKFVDFLNTYYLNKSNYLKIDGKPVVYVYNIDKADGGFMRINSGSSRTPAQVSALLTTMRNRAIYRGFSGLYIVGMGDNDYDGCGFDAITNYSHASWSGDHDYVQSTTNAQSRWTNIANANNSKFQPAIHTDALDSVWTGGSYTCTGMDILNKFGMNGQDHPDDISATGSSPSRFRGLLEDARDFVNSRSDTDRIIMINAWNEWGEGNVIEPTQQYGWGYLKGIREKTGFNPVQNWSFEDSGTSPWNVWIPGSGTFSKVSTTKTLKSTGLYKGRLSGATAAYSFAYQYISGSNFTPGRTYRAWCKIKTTNVAGNGARLRMDFRDSGAGIIATHESNAVTGTTGDYTRVVVSGTIPANTSYIYVHLCGSTNQGPGAGSIIDFDDVVFKPSIAASYSYPIGTINASDKRITGSGYSTISWNASGCSTARIYYRINNGNETYWRSGASGSQSFYATAGNVYTFNIYKDTSHTRLLNSVTVVAHPNKPSGYTVDDYEDGSTAGTGFGSHVSGISESDGVLKFHTIGSNPYYIKYSRSINTSNYDRVKVRMKVIHGNTSGQIFWNNGAGWNEADSKTFTVINDGQWHEYTIDLASDSDWSGTVTEFRLDPVSATGAMIEVDYIVVAPTEQPPEPPAGYLIDNFDDGSYSGWYFSYASGISEAGGFLQWNTTGNDPHMVHYNYSCNTSDYETVVIRMKVTNGNTSGQIFWNNGSGWSENCSQAFTVISDGQWHEYSLDLSSHAYWSGTVNAFRLDPVTTSGATVAVDYIVAAGQGSYTVDDYDDGSTSDTWFALATNISESGGILRYTSTGSTPRHQKHSGLSCDANTYETVKIRMKITNGISTTSKFYWDNGSGLSESRSQTFTVINDGQWHEYTIDMSSHAYWNGTIIQFRLDSCNNQSGATLEFDYIKIEE